MKFFETISINPAEPSRMRAIAPVVVSGLALIAGLACGAHAGGAQSPRITPKGDPSIRNDSIYSLVVRARDFPSQPFVYLFEDGVVRFEEDGRAKRTYRLVIQILTQQAAEQWGEKTFSYTTGRQRLTVNWIRVLRLNGQVISDKPAHEQESIAPVAQEAPIYSDTRVRQYTLSGVAPNTIVDYSYTIEDTEARGAGRLLPAVVHRHGTCDAPVAVHPQCAGIADATYPGAEHPLRPPRGANRTGAVCTCGRPPRFRGPSPSRSRPIPIRCIRRSRLPLRSPGVASRAGTRPSRSKRYRLTPALNQQLSTVVMGAQTLDDSLRALHRWVAQDFRYVSLSLGIGGYQPRLPMSVWETKYGDCKDKATLFIALARRMGVPAYPVLLSLTGGINRSLPSAYQLDHMIAAIARPGVRGRPSEPLPLRRSHIGPDAIRIAPAAGAGRVRARACIRMAAVKR